MVGIALTGGMLLGFLICILTNQIDDVSDD